MLIFPSPLSRVILRFCSVASDETTAAWRAKTMTVQTFAKWIHLRGFIKYLNPSD